MAACACTDMVFYSFQTDTQSYSSDLWSGRLCRNNELLGSVKYLEISDYNIFR